MARAPSLIDTALEAALTLAADKPWAELTLGAIADAAGLSLMDFHGVATRDDLGLAASAYFDRAMLSEPVDPEELPRERLFEVIMLRFEAMEAHRAGLMSLADYAERSPSMLLHLPGHLDKTAGWALVAAGLDDNSGAPLAAKRLAIASVVLQTHRAWRRETSADFALTMAALDKTLREAEDRMTWLSKFVVKRRPAQPEQESAGTEQETDS